MKSSRLTSGLRDSLLAHIVFETPKKAMYRLLCSYSISRLLLLWGWLDGVAGVFFWKDVGNVGERERERMQIEVFEKAR